MGLTVIFDENKDFREKYGSVCGLITKLRDVYRPSNVNISTF